MSRTSAPESATIGQIVGEFRSLGVSAPLPWTTLEAARAQAGELAAQLGPHRQEIVKNPHRDAEWARVAVCSATLLGAVHAVIGPDVAVENSPLHRSGSNTGRFARIGLNVRYVAPGAARMLRPHEPRPRPDQGDGLVTSATAHERNRA